jgi:DNA-binding transcriptional ArsR family regulator
MGELNGEDTFLTMLNLSQLRAFHAVATLKNFTRAAGAVHLTQPGISRHIKELEESYGVRLFERRARFMARWDRFRMFRTIWDGFDRTMVVYLSCDFENLILNS